MEGDEGGPRGGEPRVPGVLGHVQDPPDRFRTHRGVIIPKTRTSVLFFGYQKNGPKGVIKRKCGEPFRAPLGNLGKVDKPRISPVFVL